MFSLLFALLFHSFIKGDYTAIKNPLGNNVLASHEFSLENRYADSFVNQVFKDNILLTINYAAGKKVEPQKIDWKQIEKPSKYTVVLLPGQTFAFHDDVLPKFEGKISKTTNAHFNFQEGFKSDGFLTGDGVCHLASLLYWTAKDAGLSVLAPTRHDFANIPQVPREYGVSIFNYPGKNSSNELQNLYITNNKNKNIAFQFIFDGKELTIEAVEQKDNLSALPIQ